jgi:hypothetical protein
VARRDVEANEELADLNEALDPKETKVNLDCKVELVPKEFRSEKEAAGNEVAGLKPDGCSFDKASSSISAGENDFLALDAVGVGYSSGLESCQLADMDIEI